MMKVLCLGRRGEGRGSGFSMVEMLVALLILSIGLLGLAGLQARALKGSHTSWLRSQAVQGAEDILDRMRANRTLALEGGYDIALETTPDSSAYAGIPLFDLVEWKNTLAAGLPVGDGSVMVRGGVATVVVRWSESAGEQTVSKVTRL